MTGTDLPKIAAPARRALDAIGVHTIDELAGRRESEIAALHGMGPKALAALKEALHERGRAFSDQASRVPAENELRALLAPFHADVQQLALAVCTLVRETVPDAVQELDQSDKLIGFTFRPGTYKGLIVAVALHRSHVNLMFSKGVELLELDSSGLLEGTGKQARHIRFADAERLADPAVRRLVRAAADRTPRA